MTDTDGGVIMNYFEDCLNSAVTDALRLKRSVRVGLYRIVQSASKMAFYDTDIQFGECSILKGEVTLSFNMTAKAWQRKLIIDLLEKKFKNKFM